MSLKKMKHDPAEIRCVMINEVAPADPADDFYSASPDSAYLQSALSLLGEAGVEAETAEDILKLGIYFTNAVKEPKREYTVPPEAILAGQAELEREIVGFPNLRVVMLMGDVAKKSFNAIVKRRDGKNVIPAGSTYKLRHTPFHWGDIRVFPSYIMTGGNLLIEKSKRVMIIEDIREMLKLILG